MQRSGFGLPAGAAFGLSSDETRFGGRIGPVSRSNVSPERSIAATLTAGIVSAAAALGLALLLISP